MHNEDDQVLSGFVNLEGLFNSAVRRDHDMCKCDRYPQFDKPGRGKFKRADRVATPANTLRIGSMYLPFR